MKSKALEQVFVISVVIIMTVPASAVGFATTGYTATTQSTGNCISANYFTARLYTYDSFNPQSPADVVDFDSDDFTEVTGSKFNDIALPYSTEEGTKTIATNNYVMTPANLYIVVTNGVDDPFTYSMSLNFSFSDTVGTLSGVDGYITVGGTENTPETIYNSNKAYHLQFNATFTNTTFVSANDTISYVVSISTIKSVIQNMGIVVEASTCQTVISQETPVTEQVNITGVGEGIEGSYTKEESTVAGRPTVQVSNSTNESGGIADSSGNVNISISIPENTPFLIRIWNKESYKVYVNIRISNVIVNGSPTSHDYGNKEMGSNFAYFLSTYGPNWSTGSLNNVINNNAWFYSGSDPVTVRLTATFDDGTGRTAQKVLMHIMFRDAPSS